MNLYTYFTVGALIIVSCGITISAHKSGINTRKTILTIITSFVFAFFGARFLQLLTNQNMSFKEIITLDFTNFALYGGLIGGGVAGFFLGKLLRLPINKLGNLAFIWVGIGIAIMRIGCFIEGCCYGKSSDLPWGTHPPLFSPAHWHQLSEGSSTILSTQKVHPTQIYELIAALIASGLSYRYFRINKNSLIPSFIWILTFTILRLTIFFFREIPNSYTGPRWLYPVLYTLIIIFSLKLIHKKNLKLST